VETKEQITYLLDWKFSPSTGVGKKVISQIEAWGSYGLQVELVVATHKDHLKSWAEQELPIKVYGYSGIMTRRKARNDALKYAKKNNETKGFYVRFGILSLPLIFLFLKNKVIIELNFKGFKEYKRRSFFLYLYLRLTRKFIFMKCLGACAVTYEISDEFRAVTKSKVNSGVFPNSINLKKFKTLPLNHSSEINLVFVGSPGQVWHGIDRVIQLAEIFKNFKFHVIGPSKPTGICDRENIVFTGELYGTDLVEYLAKMDLGISSLAMERNNLMEGSPLKTREYLAAGLPVIAGYKDTAIDADSNYFLDLSNSTWPITNETIQKIESFATAWKGKRVPRALLSSIDSNVVENSRAKFIINILKED
jgi:glycosyltransferase involved in cell wall biosynthesis